MSLCLVCLDMFGKCVSFYFIENRIRTITILIYTFRKKAKSTALFSEGLAVRNQIIQSFSDYLAQSPD